MLNVQLDEVLDPKKKKKRNTKTERDSQALTSLWLLWGKIGEEIGSLR